MNKYRFFYFIWLLPLYFLFMNGYQWMTFQAIDQTYNNGQSYVADVLDFDVKQIAAQTSGYVVLTFETEEGNRVEQRLSLSVQMAQAVMDSERIPIRYQPGTFNEIVILSTYPLQRSVVRVNIIITFIGLLATIVLAFWSTRYANRKIRDGDEPFQIERTDNDNQA